MKFDIGPLGALAPVAPPAPQAEVVGTAPNRGHIWIAGSYTWDGSRYVWDGGHWEAPHPGYHYEPRTWVHEDDGWREHGGRWEKGNG